MISLAEKQVSDSKSVTVDTRDFLLAFTWEEASKPVFAGMEVDNRRIHHELLTH